MALSGVPPELKESPEKEVLKDLPSGRKVPTLIGILSLSRLLNTIFNFSKERSIDFKLIWLYFRMSSV